MKKFLCFFTFFILKFITHASDMPMAFFDDGSINIKKIPVAQKVESTCENSFLDDISTTTPHVQAELIEDSIEYNVINQKTPIKKRVYDFLSCLVNGLAEISAGANPLLPFSNTSVKLSNYNSGK